MKKEFALTLLCLSTLFLTACHSRTSNLETVTFYSESLKNKMKFDLYLPPNYNSNEKYPVLYLLHGKDGNSHSWMDGFFGFNAVEINKSADKLITEGKLKPLLIVSPDIDNGYGINSAPNTQAVNGYNRGMYKDYIINDLIKFVDAHYNTIPNRNQRFIGGFSMGGFAALHDSFLHQDMFSKVGVMSAAIWIGGIPSELSWIYPTENDKKLTDPITIARNLINNNVSVYIEEGEQDPFFNADSALANVLKQKNADVTYHLDPGGHTYSFWQNHSEELLLFFNSSI